jgi:hypothetical protein
MNAYTYISTLIWIHVFVGNNIFATLQQYSNTEYLINKISAKSLYVIFLHSTWTKQLYAIPIEGVETISEYVFG